MSEPFIGEIVMFAGNFAPRGWALCNGQLLAISQNTALFSILGTTYGGNGQTTFALPDLRGRVPMHQGTGPGLTPRVLGEQGGTETTTLTVGQLPPHVHDFRIATAAEADSNTPAGNLLARTDGRNYASGGAPVAVGGTSGPAGAGQPANNLPPYLAVNFIIALQGIFPSRD